MLKPSGMINQLNLRTSLRKSVKGSMLPTGFLFFSLLVSCTVKTEPYSILEFTGVSSVCNYSRSFMLMQSRSDTTSGSVVIEASPGDLITCDDYLFQFGDEPLQDRYLFNPVDCLLYVNGKLYSIEIPENENMLPWFTGAKDTDFSNLKLIKYGSRMSESYLPQLEKLAAINPGTGLWYDGEFKEMAKMLDIFSPGLILGPSLSVNDFDSLLSKQRGLKTLLISLEDSVISKPLPALPMLKQIFLTDMGEKDKITNDLFINNKQIERVMINRQGILDFSLFEPLMNLREIVAIADSGLNFNLINNHTKLELLSVGFESGFSPSIIKLPSLRRMTFPSNVLQADFDSFINTHPHLEIIEIIANDTLTSLSSLSKLSRLTGLTITDTVTDISSVKMLKNLKYLSLPADFLEKNENKTEIQNALPGVRLAANEGFCLGSGWLLLLAPLVLILRKFIRGHKNHYSAGKS